MNLEIKINRVTNLKKSADRFKVATNRSGDLWLNVTDFSLNIVDTLHSVFSSQELFVFEFLPESKEIKNMYYPVIDNIIALSKSMEQTDSIQVQAMKRPSLYFLYISHPGFLKLHEELIKANKDWKIGVEAALAVRPGEYYVNDVLLIKSQ